MTITIIIQRAKFLILSLFLFCLALLPLTLAHNHYFFIRALKKGLIPDSLPVTVLLDTENVRQLAENFFQKSKDTLEQKDLNWARYWSQKAIEINPDQAENLYLKTQILQNFRSEPGFYNDQIELLQKATALDPQNILYRISLARHYSEFGQTESAKQEFEKAMEANPGSIFTYFLSQRFLIPSLNAAIVQSLEKRIAQNSQNSYWYWYLADWYRYNNDPQKSLEVVNRGYEATKEEFLLEIKKRDEYLIEKNLEGP